MPTLRIDVTGPADRLMFEGLPHLQPVIDELGNESSATSKPSSTSPAEQHGQSKCPTTSRNRSHNPKVGVRIRPHHRQKAGHDAPTGSELKPSPARRLAKRLNRPGEISTEDTRLLVDLLVQRFPPASSGTGSATAA